MDNNQGGPGEEGAQGEPTEPEDTEKSRTYAARNGEPEPGIPVVNGEKETSKGEPGTEEIRASDEVGDRDLRRPQEKKKAKGLGEGELLLTGGSEHLPSHGLACSVWTQENLLFKTVHPPQFSQRWGHPIELFRSLTCARPPGLGSQVEAGIQLAFSLGIWKTGGRPKCSTTPLSTCCLTLGMFILHS